MAADRWSELSLMRNMPYYYQRLNAPMKTIQVRGKLERAS